MRMRKRNNLEPRMEAASAVWIREPETHRGHWRALMPEAQALHLEIGCGKGKFTVEMAALHPEILFLAVERVREAMVLAMEKAVAMELKNVFFLSVDAAQLEELFAPGEVDRIYLNFCDPWPRSKNAKRRLTYHSFLEKYRVVLRPDGEIHFKTDNAQLFAWSLEEFARYGYPVRNVTDDLHKDGVVGVMTGYEEKFHALGTPIHRCEIGMPPRAAAAEPPAAESRRKGSADPRVKIILADDEALWRQVVHEFLAQEGYAVLEAADGQQAVELLRANPEVSLVILDLMMPVMDGLAACREIRSFSRVPVMMVTARDDEQSEISGFRDGVDQYVSKPVKMGVFMERVKSLLRRSGKERELLRLGALELDPANAAVRVDGEPVSLTPKEFDLLLYLARNANTVRSREQILHAVWNTDYYGDCRTVDTHVKNLRMKLGPCGEMVRTVRSRGYLLETEPQ